MVDKDGNSYVWSKPASPFDDSYGEADGEALQNHDGNNAEGSSAAASDDEDRSSAKSSSTSKDRSSAAEGRPAIEVGEVMLLNGEHEVTVVRIGGPSDFIYHQCQSHIIALGAGEEKLCAENGYKVSLGHPR